MTANKPSVPKCRWQRVSPGRRVYDLNRLSLDACVLYFNDQLDRDMAAFMADGTFRDPHYFTPYRKAFAEIRRTALTDDAAWPYYTMTPASQEETIMEAHVQGKWRNQPHQTVHVANWFLTDLNSNWADDWCTEAATEMLRELALGRRGWRGICEAYERCVGREKWRRMHKVWKTPTVVSLARQIVESGDESTCPILADALEDAGCDNAEVLANLRNPVTSVEWAVLEITGLA